MNRDVRIVCVLAIGCAALWSTGCSSKTVRSTGQANYATPAAIDTSSRLTETDIPATMSPVVVAKADPAAARRQLDEMRAEQSATSAAGLRDVFFGYDSWTISDEGRQALSRDAEWLRANPAVQVKVEGHCDERGSSTYNLILAEKRSKSVRNYLMELGVPRERVTVVSYGKERPFCKDRSEACYQQNRRGHLVVKP